MNSYIGVAFNSVLSIFSYNSDLLINDCSFSMCTSQNDGGAISINYFENLINILSTTFYACTGYLSGAISITNSYNTVSMNKTCFNYCYGNYSNVYLDSENDFIASNTYTVSNLCFSLSYVKAKTIDFEGFNTSYFTFDNYLLEIISNQNINIKYSFLHNILYHNFSSNGNITFIWTYLNSNIPSPLIFDFSTSGDTLFDSCFFEVSLITSNNITIFLNCFFKMNDISDLVNNSNFIFIDPDYSPDEWYIPFQSCDMKYIKTSDVIRGVQDTTITSSPNYNFTVEECLFQGLKSFSDKAGAISIDKQFIISIVSSTFDSCISDYAGAIYLNDAKVENLEKNCFLKNIGNEYSDLYISTSVPTANYFSFSYGPNPTIFSKKMYHLETAYSSYFNVTHPLVISLIHDIKLTCIFDSYYANIMTYCISMSSLASFHNNIFINITQPCLKIENRFQYLIEAFNILNCTFFHINGFEKLFKSNIQNSFIDNETIAKEYTGLSYSNESSTNFPYNFDCFVYIPPNIGSSKTKVIIISISVCTAVLLIIIAVLIFVAFKYKRDSKLNKFRLELSQKILNDFG